METSATESGDSQRGTSGKGDFIKLVSDFTKDVLTTFPELGDKLNENLRQVVIAESTSEIDSDVVDYIWNKCEKVYPPRLASGA